VLAAESHRVATWKYAWLARVYRFLWLEANIRYASGWFYTILAEVREGGEAATIPDVRKNPLVQTKGQGDTLSNYA
jgi:hypothetical protein